MNIPLWRPVDPRFEGLSQGEATELFEKKVAEFLRVKYAIAVSSGTAALFLALKAIGTSREYRVLVPDLTSIATVNAVSMCGAKVVLGDIDRNNCLDWENETKEFNVAIPVHLNGRAAKIPKDVFVIEDACQAFGSRDEDGGLLGTLGDCGCFSFSPTKTVFTGQGGMIVTKHRWLYDQIKMLRDQGRRCKGEVYVRRGYNFKFTDLQAKIGLEQMRVIDEILSRKREIYAKYYDELKSWMFAPSSNEVIWLPDVYSLQRDELHCELNKKGIETRKFYPPIHTQQPYLTNRDFPKSENASERGLWLPSNPTDEEIRYIYKEIKKILGD